MGPLFSFLGAKRIFNESGAWFGEVALFSQGFPSSALRELGDIVSKVWRLSGGRFQIVSDSMRLGSYLYCSDDTALLNFPKNWLRPIFPDRVW